MGRAWPDRLQPLPGQRGWTWLLVALVFAGGICPALYGAQLPHEHLFVGGPPPANWEQHRHANLLLLLFGPPGPSERPDDDLDLAPASSTPGISPRAIADGRVISLYPGTDPSVLTLIDFAVIVPIIRTPIAALVPARLVTASLQLRPQTAEAPDPPPPRFL